MSKNVIMSVSNKIVDNYGNVYNSIRQLAKYIHVSRGTISAALNSDGVFLHKGVEYKLAKGKMLVKATPITESKPAPTKRLSKKEKEEQREFEEYKLYKKVKALDFEVYDMEPIKGYTAGYRYAVALFSDAHIEETVKPETVNWLNEYNLEIAEKRIKTYFVNLANCLKEDNVTELIFSSLGDTITSYLHPELEQTNQCVPLEATLKAQNLIYSGLHYLCCEANIKSLKRIRFIGIVGNHSRTTKKIQHANGFKLSYEWLMYQNIKQQCENANLPIDFCIPDSEIAIVKTTDNRTLIFCHGFQIKGGTNTICGVYPALQRLALRWGKVFNQDRIYMGHFHSCISIPSAAVNGSVIGYNSFALTNGFEYQEPCQYYEVIDTNIGQLLERKIYCK